MKQHRETNVAITAEYPQFGDAAILAHVVPELVRKDGRVTQPISPKQLSGKPGARDRQFLNDLFKNCFHQFPDWTNKRRPF